MHQIKTSTFILSHDAGAGTLKQLQALQAGSDTEEYQPRSRRKRTASQRAAAAEEDSDADDEGMYLCCTRYLFTCICFFIYNTCVMGTCAGDEGDMRPQGTPHLRAALLQAVQQVTQQSMGAPVSSGKGKVQQQSGGKGRKSLLPPVPVTHRAAHSHSMQQPALQLGARAQHALELLAQPHLIGGQHHTATHGLVEAGIGMCVGIWYVLCVCIVLSFCGVAGDEDLLLPELAAGGGDAERAGAGKMNCVAYASVFLNLININILICCRGGDDAS